MQVRWSRALPGEASQVTVTVDASGRWHCSFVVEAPDAPLPRVSQEVGIDLGLTHFAVLSDGTKVERPADRAEGRGGTRAAQRNSPAARGAVGEPREVTPEGRPRPCPGGGARGVTGCTSCPPPLVRENQLVAVEDLDRPSRGWRRRARWARAGTTPDGGGSSACSPTRRSGPGGRWGRSGVRSGRPGRAKRVGPSARGKPRALWASGLADKSTRSDRDVNAAGTSSAAGRAVMPVEPVSGAPSGAQSAVKQEPTGSAQPAAQTGIPGNTAGRTSTPGAS